MISSIIESRVPFLISLFNFQGPIACPLSKTAQRVYHTLFLLSILFWKFFEIFFKSFRFLLFLTLFALSCVSLAESLYILPPCKLFVNTFYKLFWLFFTIYLPLYTPCRAFLCLLGFVTLYLGSCAAFRSFCLDRVWS